MSAEENAVVGFVTLVEVVLPPEYFVEGNTVQESVICAEVVLQPVLTVLKAVQNLMSGCSHVIVDVAEAVNKTSNYLVLDRLQ